ncbi:hypothetical protein ABZ820_33655 [Streptomyces diacarni]|uniref:hypothetical protein n=1 Tax=Streptomyces diacarni TaxID=2800381 RepID=UPI003402A05B
MTTTTDTTADTERVEIVLPRKAPQPYGALDWSGFVTGLTRTYRHPAACTPEGKPLPGKAVPGEGLLLPPGWTVENNGSMPWALFDDLGRLRGTIQDGTITLNGPEGYAREVAERGVALVLDEWARPGLMLGTVGERIDTYISLLHLNAEQAQRWQHEQPKRAAELRSQSSRYQSKLDSYRRLLRLLAAAATSDPTAGS